MERFIVQVSVVLTLLALLVAMVVIRSLPARGARPTQHKLPALVTTLINTCCRGNTPSTKTIEITLRSLLQDPSLAARIIVVCDGYSDGHREDLNEKCRGECDGNLYNDYVARIEEIVGDIFPHSDSRIVVMESRSCLTTSVQRGLEVCTTEFVHLMQDDIALRRPCPVPSILSALISHPRVSLVRLVEKTNRYEEEYAATTCGQRRRESMEEISLSDGTTLSHCSLYSDMNHFSSLSFYRDILLPACKRYDFMEHTLACAQRGWDNNVPDMLPGKLWYLGGYADGHYISHLDGRTEDGALS